MNRAWSLLRNGIRSGALLALLTTALTLALVHHTGGKESDFLPLIYLPIILAVVRCEFETIILTGLLVTCGFLFLVRHPIGLREFDSQDVVRALTINLMALIGASYARRVQHERKQLRSTVEEQEALLNVSQVINAAEKQDQALDSALLLLRTLIPPLQSAAIFLIDDQQRFMRLAAVIGASPESLKRRQFSLNTRRLRWNPNHAHPLYLADVGKRRDMPLADIDPRARSVVLVSLRALDIPIGALYVSSDQPHAFTDQQINLLKVFAGRIGFPLQKIRVQENLHGMAYTDAMTGLRNYRYFRSHLADELQQAARFKRPLSLLIIDLDEFKSINDRYGHPAGDRLLIEIAGVIRGSVREADLAARYGGEEFVVVCPETNHTDGLLVAERIRAMAEGMRFQIAPGETCAVTISVGLATYPLDGHDETTLLHAADAALYHAKRTGKNRVIAAQMVARDRRKAA